MAAYTISTAVTNTGTAQAINTNDSVTVTSSGSLTGTGTAGIGIYSINSGGSSGGFDTIAVSGTVRGSEYGLWDAGSAGNDTVTVNAGGNIFGGYNAGLGAAIYIEGGSNTIGNDGNIVDNLGGYGIHVSGSGNSIDNSGTITTTVLNAIYIDGGSNSIDNSGMLSSGLDDGIEIGGDHNAISNSGTVTSYYGIQVNGDSSIVANTGTINGFANSGVNFHGDHNAVTNSGTIEGYYYGAYITGDSNSVTNSGTIVTSTGNEAALYFYGTKDVVHNTAGGTISGDKYGVWVHTGKSAVITNAGTIKGGATGIYIQGGTNTHIKVQLGGSITATTGEGIDTSGNAMHVVDKGAIAAHTTGVYLYGVDAVVKVGAHGTVSGGLTGIYDEGGQGDHIFNAGTISGSQSLGIDLDIGGSARIHNTGSIISGSNTAIYSDNGADRITNKGAIEGSRGLYVEAGHDTVSNLGSGTIKASAVGIDHDVLYFGGGTNTITNDGKILLALHGYSSNAAIHATSGSNTILNTSAALISDYHGGQIDNYAVELDGKNNAVTNSGKIVGTVQIGTTGANSYDGSSGHLKGTVVGGTGSDTITLGGGHSGVDGGGGADSITIGTGEDNVIYTAGTDSNITTYDAVDGFTAGTDTFTFNLGGNALNGLTAVAIDSLAAVDTSHISAAVAGYLDPYGAIALSVSSGLYAGDVFLIVDHSGTTTFNNTNDYFVALTHLSGTLSASDILTT